MRVLQNQIMKILKNPKTVNYKQLKSLVLSENFPWHKNVPLYKVMPGCPDNHTFMSHTFLARPTNQMRYSTVQSNAIDLCYRVFMEIFEFNQMGIKCIYRMNANKTYPDSGNGDKCAQMHVDHSWNHNNILIYLTNAGGKTIVPRIGKSRFISRSHNPKEDDIMQFGGLFHTHEYPKRTPRVVLVGTYI